MYKRQVLLGVLRQDLHQTIDYGHKITGCEETGNYIHSLIKECKLFKNGTIAGASCILYRESLESVSEYYRIAPVIYGKFMLDIDYKDTIIDDQGHVVIAERCKSFVDKENLLTTIRQNTEIKECQVLQIREHRCIHNLNRSAETIIGDCNFKLPQKKDTKKEKKY